ncbi:RDD family protein [Streptomyces sp. NPDC049954]|uniref:RDD family protein n=1 Tax=Streptomyces sp. NPDC049954 TaxID=3155779 RepID=UPI0034203C2D
MTSAPPPPGSGDEPDDDPFRKRQPPAGQGGASGSPYDPPPGEGSPYGEPGPGRGYDPPPAAQGGGQGSPYDPPGSGYDPPGPGSPYGPPGGTPPPYGGEPGSPYGGAPGGGDPLAGMAPLAPSGKRVIARIIDMVIVGIVVYLLSLLFNISETNPDRGGRGSWFGQSLLAAILYIAYDVILTGRGGQTLGKRIMKLRVARLDNGATPTTQALVTRAAVLWLPFAFCCACVWTAICGGWSFIDKPYKQGLHDKAAKTVVVSV